MTTLRELSEEMLASIATYHCDKIINLLQNNNTVRERFEEIIAYESLQSDKYKILYHGRRSMVTNLYLFAEIIMNVKKSNKPKYFFKGVYENNKKVPQNVICAVPTLFKNVEYPGESIFDFMDNHQCHERMNYEQALDKKYNHVPENEKLNIDNILQDLKKGRFIKLSQMDELKTTFQSFENANPDSHTLVIYGILINDANSKHTEKFDNLHFYSPEGGPAYHITQENLSPNNYHVKLINLNPNDNDVVINQFHNVNIDPWKIRIGQILNKESESDSE